MIQFIISRKICEGEREETSSLMVDDYQGVFLEKWKEYVV